VTGIKARVGETKTFVIPCEEFLTPVAHICFETKCVWAHYHRAEQDWKAGYQITKISTDHMAHLRNFLQAAISGVFIKACEDSFPAE